jgi:hypothetical protein
MESVLLRLRLAESFDRAERIDDRLRSAQDALESVRDRLQRGRQLIEVCAAFRGRAISRSRFHLAARWLELQGLSERAARREREALSSLERLHHLLEVTAQFAWADCEALQHEANGVVLSTSQHAVAREP